MISPHLPPSNIQKPRNIRHRQYTAIDRERQKRRCFGSYAINPSGSKPVALAGVLNVLTNSKWPPGIEPDGHHFVVLNDSHSSNAEGFQAVVTSERSRNVYDTDFEATL